MVLNLPVSYVVPFVSDQPGSGNPAAVCVVPPEQLISEATMSAIAIYLGQPETVFAKRRKPGVWELCWFTQAGLPIVPGGNGTVALAYLLLTELEVGAASVQLNSTYPGLSCSARLDEHGRVCLTLPAIPPRQIDPSHRYTLLQALGNDPHTFYCGERDLIAIYDSEADVRDLQPNFNLLVTLPYFAFIATASGDRGGFVYRTFITAQGREKWECPGSAAALMNLAPLWDSKLTSSLLLHAVQLSLRGGEAWCRLLAGELMEITAACEKRGGPFVFQFPALSEEDMESFSADLNSSLFWK